MQTLTGGQSSPEVLINENFDSLTSLFVFGKRHPDSSGLSFAYYGGVWGGLVVADGVVTLTNSSTNYVVVNRLSGAVSVSTSTTNWLNPAYARAHKVTTAVGVVTAWEDHRCGFMGTHGFAQRTPSVSADRGDASQTLTAGTDATTQRWATTLTTNRAVTLSTTAAVNGDRFRIVRTGLGAFTLDVGGLKTIPSATAAWVDVEFDGTAWRLTGYGTL